MEIARTNHPSSLDRATDSALVHRPQYTFIYVDIKKELEKESEHNDIEEKQFK